MSLRYRFLLSLLAVLALLAIPALYAVTRVSMLRDVVLELRGEAAQSALAVGRLDAALVSLDRSQRVYVATTDPDAAAAIHVAFAEIAATVATLRGAGHEDDLEESGFQLFELRESATRIEELIQQGLAQEATAYLKGTAVPLVERSRAAVPGIARTIDLKTAERVSLAQRSAVASSTATTAAVLVGVALAFSLAIASARVLTGPLGRLRRAMAIVADGRFETTFDLPYHRRDEVGDLSRSFRTMTLRLTELDRLKSEFVGAVSHDLKTPVAVVTGYADLLEEELSGRLTAREHSLLRSLTEQTRSLQRRIDQLMEISRLETGRLRLGLEEVELRHFAGELEREFQPAVLSRRLTLQLTVHENAPRVIVADPDVLRSEIVGNILRNALEFTPAGGNITVAFRADGQRLSIEIADSGPGIPQEELPRIFDRYYQHRDGSSPRAGLGLSIARAGVENHGGRIEVQSRPGRGTRFRITLPIRSVSTALVEQRPELAVMAG